MLMFISFAVGALLLSVDAWITRGIDVPAGDVGIDASARKAP